MSYLQEHETASIDLMSSKVGLATKLYLISDKFETIVCKEGISDGYQEIVQLFEHGGVIIFEHHNEHFNRLYYYGILVGQCSVMKYLPKNKVYEYVDYLNKNGELKFTESERMRALYLDYISNREVEGYHRTNYSNSISL